MSVYIDFQSAPFVAHFSEATAREIDVAVRDSVSAAFERALQILTKQRAVLEKGALLLLEKETLSGDELPALE